ncbi:hypothetical protein MEQU1_001656 [Malassezia equina]|uniref:TLC domain-containing protein n=1 Tax=Malassezia equina TaxID=1381935 RepID=A0AAF0IZ15_9BASI|nr:hypothetical protein MEQU1_001656 [Malassezia equina]
MLQGEDAGALAYQALTSHHAVTFAKSFVFIQLIYQVFAWGVFHGASEDQKRKRSWIITTFCAFCSSMVAAPFAFDLIWCGLDWTKVTPHRESVADPLSVFFLAYLLSDLLTGVLCYRKHVNMSSGWIHHTLYALFTVFWLYRGWSHCFATALLMELPTWVMGIGNLHPRLRSYWAFTLSFLATRIVFHFLLLYSLVVPTGHYVHKEVPSVGPLIFCGLALPMHLIWAYKSVRGLRRRMKKLKAEARAREEAQRAAISEATRLLDSADELESGDDMAKAGAPRSRVTVYSSDAPARAREMVSHAVRLLWYSAPQAWRQAYQEELEFNKLQGIDPASLRHSTLVRRALARQLLQRDKRGHNVPLVGEDDEDDLDDWMSITSLNSVDQNRTSHGRKVTLGRGIHINVPRELDPILNGQKYVVSEYPVDREASGTRRQRLVGQMRRRFEVARRDMVVF